MTSIGVLERIAPKLIVDNNIIALYVDNSNINDYIIHLYCVVNPKGLERFKEQLLTIIESYNIVIYSKENVNGITYIYDDGKRLNIYFQNENSCFLPSTYEIIYDPKRLLDRKQVFEKSYTNQDIGDLIDRFACYCLDFTNYYSHKDIVMAMSIAMKMIEVIGTFLRIIDDYPHASLGIANCIDALTKEHKIGYANIIKEYRYNNLLSCVQLMILLMANEIKLLPIEIGQFVNFDLFDLAKKNFFMSER